MPESRCDREGGGVTDELDNQVITNGGQHLPTVSENLQKRKLIGDEFYREDEKIVKLHSIIVNPSKLAAELAAQLSNSPSISNKTPTIVSTESFFNRSGRKSSESKITRADNL